MYVFFLPVTNLLYFGKKFPFLCQPLGENMSGVLGYKVVEEGKSRLAKDRFLYMTVDCSKIDLPVMNAYICRKKFKLNKKKLPTNTT